MVLIINNILLNTMKRLHNNGVTTLCVKILKNIKNIKDILKRFFKGSGGSGSLKGRYISRGSKLSVSIVGKFI